MAKKEKKEKTYKINGSRLIAGEWKDWGEIIHPIEKRSYCIRQGLFAARDLSEIVTHGTKLERKFSKFVLYIGSYQRPDFKIEIEPAVEYMVQHQKFN